MKLAAMDALGANGADVTTFGRGAGFTQQYDAVSSNAPGPLHATHSAGHVPSALTLLCFAHSGSGAGMSPHESSGGGMPGRDAVGMNRTRLRA
jgi:hypothetical protein